jgi:3-hydroxyacyl-[acyl-carrier-protein] dehydratase
VSRLIDVQPGKSATGIWSLSGTEPFFAGHFPGHPIVPGLLIAEALAQVSGLAGPEDVGAAGKLVHVDVRFLQPVSPPAEIELRSKFVNMAGALQTCQVQATHGGVVVARGTVTLHRSARQV